MKEFLNNNQWVIAGLTLLATIIGFIVTNRHIKIKQKQKSGKNSSNVQIWNVNTQKYEW